MVKRLLSVVRHYALDNQLVHSALRPTARRGFGIQSPWAFRLVRDIIGAKHPYYAYECLASTYSTQSKRERKHHELLFRLANYCQPDTFIEQTGDMVACEYIAAACKKTRFHTQLINLDPQLAKATILWHTDISKVCLSDFEYISPKSLLIVEGINRNSETKSKWKVLLDSPLVSVTFNVSSFAIVSFDPKRPKQLYFI